MYEHFIKTWTLHRPGTHAEVLTRHCAPEFVWRGMHPFNEQRGADAVATVFWDPLKTAFTHLQRREHIFLAGDNDIDAGRTQWTISMGHWLTLWEQPWLGFAPSGKATFLRYVEFCRVTDGQVAEIATFLDLLDVLAQGGIHPLPPQTGAHLVTPGPRTQNGILLDPQPEQQGRQTMHAIDTMIAELIDLDVASPMDHLQKHWTPDMSWYGPAGIGTSYTREGYQRHHAGPFETTLQFVRHYGHICRTAEGYFGGFFGYPSLAVKMTGGFMGLPANDVEADMRIVDMYRREGDKLAENWIFIDMPHFLLMQGLDVLERARQFPRT